jgi:tRNA threonylcarbamoyladenosine modification (KEOPS) complex Cgi121 subunit
VRGVRQIDKAIVIMGHAKGSLEGLQGEMR